MTNRRLCAAFGLIVVTGAVVGCGWAVLRILQLVDDAQATL